MYHVYSYRRKKSTMKNLLLLLLLLPLISVGKLGDYYNAEGHPKAKGLSFKIKIPLGFEKNEADRPNIVQKWEKYKTDNDKYVSLMILVKKFPSEMQGFGIDDWTQYLKNDGGVDDLAPDDAYNKKFIVVDNYPAVSYDCSLEMSRMNLTFIRYMTTIFVPIGDNGFSIMFQTPSKKLLEENKLLLYRLVNSVIFIDQYR